MPIKATLVPKRVKFQNSIEFSKIFYKHIRMSYFQVHSNLIPDGSMTFKLMTKLALTLQPDRLNKGFFLLNPEG